MTAGAEYPRGLNAPAGLILRLPRVKFQAPTVTLGAAYRARSGLQPPPGLSLSRRPVNAILTKNSSVVHDTSGKEKTVSNEQQQKDLLDDEVETNVDEDEDSSSDEDTDQYEWGEDEMDDDSLSEVEPLFDVFPPPEVLFRRPIQLEEDSEFGAVAKEWPEQDSWKAEKSVGVSIAMNLTLGTLSTCLIGGGVAALPMMATSYFVRQGLLHGSEFILPQPRTHAKGAFAKALPENLGGHVTGFVEQQAPLLQDFADVSYYVYEEMKRDALMSLGLDA